MTTNRIASAAMPFGLPKVIGDRMLTLSPLSAINTIVDIAGCFYIADDEISRLMHPILRKVAPLGSSVVGLDESSLGLVGIAYVTDPRIVVWIIQLFWISMSADQMRIDSIPIPAEADSLDETRHCGIF